MSTRSRGADARVLGEIISTVSSARELSDALGDVVDVLCDASAAQASFVYLRDTTGNRLVMRAASTPYRPLIGHVTLERGEGVAWWALENRMPAFVRDGVRDERLKQVPELECGRFPSLIAMPIFGQRSDALGAILLRADAEREFTAEDAELLASTASLLATAVEHARLNDTIRRRTNELEELTKLGEVLAGVETLADLGSELVGRANELIGARSTHLYLVGSGDSLQRCWSAPGDDTAPERMTMAELIATPDAPPDASRVILPLVVNGEVLGALRAEGTSDDRLARAIANQAVVALKKVQATERLTARDVVHHLFDDVRAGAVRPSEIVRRAERVGLAHDAKFMVLVSSPPSRALEDGLGRALPGALFDRASDSVTRALLPVRADGPEALVEIVCAVHAKLAEKPEIGLSEPCAGVTQLGHGLRQAEDAAFGASVLGRVHRVVRFEDLGAYRYLLHLPPEVTDADTLCNSIHRLSEYDEAHGSELLLTLDELVARRGAIRETARALYIHPNTLRQRLERIEHLTGIDVRGDDWLAVGIAAKLAFLRRARANGSGAR